MRLRNLVAATAASALTIGLAGALSVPAHSVTAPPTANAGTLATWGDEDDPNGGAAIPVPGDLAGPVTSVAANQNATGVVTLDGGVRVWGKSDAAEVTVPAGLTDATAIALTTNNGAVLHTDGHVSAWGDSLELSEVPSDLRAKAIALQIGTGYAVRPDGTLTTWGETPLYTLPETGLTDLVDVAANNTHILALHTDGTVTIWGNEFLPGLLDVPDFGGKKVVKIAAGMGYSGVVFEDGTIDIWGSFLAPTGEPTFDGLTPAGKVIDLSLAQNAAAVTADGTVHAWGPNTLVTDVPASLSGKPVSAVAVGTTHAAAIITAFRDVTKPTITGTPKVGQSLTATPATFSMTPDAPATGQWYAGADPIAGKTATTMALDTAHLGKTISYRTTATRDGETITSASAATAAVTPVTVASATTLAVTPTTGAIGSTRTITATVTKTGGTPTGTVTFTQGSTTATAALTAGKATWALPANLAVGNHQVTATYTGDSTTNPSTATALTVTVTKADAKITAKAKPKGKTKKVAKKTTITITVKTTTGINPAGKVTITLKGKTKKTITTKVNNKGKATITVKNLKHGKYKATLKYTGNTNVNTATGKTTFKA